MEAQGEHGIGDIDLVVVNLYPFEEALGRDRAHDELIETIDIGGPALIRAAAKNHDSVTVIADPADYSKSSQRCRPATARRRPETRRALAAKAFARTAAYDSAVSNWLLGETGGPAPAWRALGGHLARPALWREPASGRGVLCLGGPGKALRRPARCRARNFLQQHQRCRRRRWNASRSSTPAHAAACVIVKHANPCGVAVAPSLLEAYRLALRCDPVSAYGGIVAFNRPLDEATAANWRRSSPR
jgi:phosphoribosylaminoimidazolecarboxamide formyltransferase / IMP cyclohydrolase